MPQLKPTTIDFETHGAKGRPDYPPKPIGVSIKRFGKKAKYYAFGHIEGNNCTFSEAKEAVRKAYRTKDGVLFQNAKFDIDVAEEWFGLELPEWQRIHDTMILLYLFDPHQRNIGLKESAERILLWPPDEQDEVCDWLLENQPVEGVKISKSKNSPNYFMNYLYYASGKLVGKYANGDVDRTEALFVELYKEVVIDRDMLEPYDRERQLIPILLDMERQGVPVDRKRLDADIEMYEFWQLKIDLWITKKLGREININSGAQLVPAMIEAGLADPSKMPLTKTGKISTAKDSLLKGVTDHQFLAVMNYRTQLNTCLNTFMWPWSITAEKSKGLIYTTWNSVKAPKGDKSQGTRTGRLSSTPNFQNIPNQFKPYFKADVKGREAKRKLPSCPFKGLPPLPKVRSYVIPFKGHTLVDRDYSQQEIRILGHYDGGSLMTQYNENPWMDAHDRAQNELAMKGKHYDRKPVKNTNFGIIYGMGNGLLAQSNDMTVEDAKKLKKAILDLYPGVKYMMQEMKRRAKCNEPIRTWGGRVYYCEPAKIVDGRLREFDYKMLNVLIQGSAADCTKEALIRFYKVKKPEWKVILNVHDQLTLSVPHKDVKEAMEVLRREMESIDMDVPMLSEGSVSRTNWSELIDYDVKGRVVAA